MTLNIVLLLLLLGLVTGFYSGLIGTGGNVILIPALDMLFVHFGIEGPEAVKYIIGHSLFVSVFLGAAVSYRQIRIRNFYLPEVLAIGLPGMVTAYLMSEWINTSGWYDKFYFDLVFLTMLLLLVVRLFFFHPKISPETTTALGGKKLTMLMGLGGVTGCITSLSGLGGGVLLVPFLTDVYRAIIQKASSISIGVITLLALSVSLSYLFSNRSQVIDQLLPGQVGYISIYLVIPILVGIFIASSYGVKLAQKMAPRRLRVIFGIVVMALCLKMIIGLL